MKSQNEFSTYAEYYGYLRIYLVGQALIANADNDASPYEIAKDAFEIAEACIKIMQEGKK